MNLFEKQSAEFASRHIGPDETETKDMLTTIGLDSLNQLIDKTVPAGIRLPEDSLEEVGEAISEFEYLSELKNIANKNKVFKSYIGQGYYDTITPSVIGKESFRKSGMVHTIHALPGRDCTRPAGKPFEFSNHGE